LANSAFTRDRLRILRAGLNYDLSDRWNGITSMRAMLHRGLPGLGASSSNSGLASRAAGSSDFTKLTLDLNRLQQLSDRVSLMSSFTGQYSAARLLASEEFSLGGANFGRAFDSGQITADKGLAASLELRYAPAGLPRNAQIYGFADSGRLWTADGNNVSPHTRLASFGGGVRASLNSKLYATLELAKPIDPIVGTQGGKNARAFLAIRAQF
jgi:hemolysin activation/secretion protein